MKTALESDSYRQVIFLSIIIHLLPEGELVFAGDAKLAFWLLRLAGHLAKITSKPKNTASERKPVKSQIMIVLRNCVI